MPPTIQTSVKFHFKLGNFTNFTALFSVVLTDFPELVHVKSGKKNLKKAIDLGCGCSNAGCCYSPDKSLSNG